MLIELLMPYSGQPADIYGSKTDYVGNATGPDTLFIVLRCTTIIPRALLNLFISTLTGEKK